MGEMKDLGEESVDNISSSVVGSGVVEVIEFTEVTEVKDSNDVVDRDGLLNC